MKFVRPGASEEVNVNLTPLIDVVFLLLIFFMVSTTFTKESRITLTLPEAEGEPAVEIPQSLEITISASGEYGINGRALVNREIDTLKAALTELAKGEKLPIVISADASASHQAVMRALDAAGQLGFVQINLTAMKPKESEN